MADIPRQRLNVDPRGFAGPMLPPMGGPPGMGAGGGVRGDIFDMLRQQQAMRQRLAAAQLAMMKAELNRSDLMGRGGPSPLETEGMAQAVKRAALENKILSEQGREMKMENEGRRGMLGQALSNLNPLGFGQMARQTAYGRLMGNTGYGGFQPSKLRGPSAVQQAFQERMYANALRNPYSATQSKTALDKLPTFTASQTPSTAIQGRKKKGTLPGTVPKTGNYQLHKGEIVISEPQVDEPLLGFLIGDKLRKGITDKNPKGRSYEEGSLIGPGPYVRPSWTPYPDVYGGFTLPNRPDLLRRLGPGYQGGFELPEDPGLAGPNLDPYQPSWSPDVDLGPGATTEEWTQLGRKMRGLKKGKPLGPSSTVDDFAEALAKHHGVPKASYKGIGKYALVSGVIGAGLATIAQLSGEKDSGRTAPPGYVPSTAEAIGIALGQGPRAVGETIGKIGGFLGGVGRGFTGDIGPDQATAPAAVQQHPGITEDPAAINAGALGGGPEVAAEQDDTGLQAALARVAAGDFGTRFRTPYGSIAPDEIKPLTLRGTPPEPGEIGTKEWNETQSKKIDAVLNRAKADRIRSYAMGVSDPDVRKDLMQEARFLDTVSDQAEGREQEIKMRREELRSASSDAMSKIAADFMKAQAKDQKLTDEKRQQHLEDLDDKLDDYAKEWRTNGSKWDERATESAVKSVKRIILMQAQLEGIDLDELEAGVLARQHFGFSQEEAMDAEEAASGE